ncbi:ribosome recycling factor-domain-containing protein [Polychytrium aggregatum]|uniref:ribosome recycling factor-domain-containing protein n=1 Tax=Polychytrium aggregatum TaxID=110093 RepID=UPI0022FEA87B|nr:ribosome recycling factor-domain-containing protein [Polychytrium aggregatum]KAI9209765.1 ribosome recycling factor-domain-containing protein [Polychytrium aggregatum]
MNPVRTASRSLLRSLRASAVKPLALAIRSCSAVPCASLHQSMIHPAAIATAVPRSLCIASQIRGYASKKQPKGGKGKGGKGGKKVEDDGDDADFADEEHDRPKGKKGRFAETSPASSEALYDIQKCKSQLQRVLGKFKADLGEIRMGRANPAILEKVVVKHGNQNAPLTSVAQVTIKDPQTLLVNVNDAEFVTQVVKALQEANLGLNPQRDENNVIRVPIPKASKETKDNLIKSLNDMAEKTKKSLRSARADARSDMKRGMEDSSEDLQKSMDKQIQAEFDAASKEVDTLLLNKQNEIRKA